MTVINFQVEDTKQLIEILSLFGAQFNACPEEFLTPFWRKVLKLKVVDLCDINNCVWANPSIEDADHSDAKKNYYNCWKHFLAKLEHKKVNSDDLDRLMDYKKILEENKEE